MENRKRYLKVTKKLLLFVGISLAITVTLFGITFFTTTRLMITWLVFQCGIIGGFVSIQQRLKKIDKDELAMLSESWASILLVPIYGGVFSLLLYVIFLAQVIKGGLFPEFYIPQFGNPVTDTDVKEFLTRAYPSSGHDLAKLIFWSFVAGFSERFVPQIIHTITSQAEDENKTNDET